jgi:hypothetical protein
MAFDYGKESLNMKAYGTKVPPTVRILPSFYITSVEVVVAVILSLVELQPYISRCCVFRR